MEGGSALHLTHRRKLELGRRQIVSIAITRCAARWRKAKAAAARACDRIRHSSLEPLSRERLRQKGLALFRDVSEPKAYSPEPATRFSLTGCGWRCAAGAALFAAGDRARDRHCSDKMRAPSKAAVRPCHLMLRERQEILARRDTLSTNDGAAAAEGSRDGADGPPIAPPWGEMDPAPPECNALHLCRRGEVAAP
jgi:hypothetical protein